MFELSLVVFLSVLVRTWPFIFDRQVQSTDTWLHDWRATEIRKNGYRIPKENSEFILKGRCCYPPALHYLMLLFPEGPKRTRFAPLLSPFFDLLQWGYLYYLYKNSIWIYSTTELAVLGIVFFLSPVCIQFKTTSTYALKARTMGRLFTNGIFIFFQVSLSAGYEAWPFWVAASCLALLVVSSKFGLQAFIAIGLAVGTVYPSIFILTLAGLAISLVITGGFSFHILREHVAHQYAYFKKGKYYGTSSEINQPEYFLFLLKPSNYIHHLKRCYVLLRDHISLSRGLLLVPVSFYFLFATIATGRGEVFLNQENLYLSLWGLGVIGAWLFTSIPAFLSLGQPTRYLEYMLLPTGVFVARYGTDYGLTATSLLAVYAVFYAVTNYAHLKKLLSGGPVRAKDADLSEAKAKLASMGHQRLICVPMKMALVFANNHDHLYLWKAGYFPLDFYDKAFKPARAPYPRNIKLLRDEYDLTACIIRARHMDEFQAQLAEADARRIGEYGECIFFDISRGTDNAKNVENED